MAPKCDFCSSPNVHWAYPARDFVINMPDVVHDWGSAGGWAACQVCHALIQRGDRDRLAMRSAKRIRRIHSQLSLRETLIAVRRAQDDFWANREGKPTEVNK